MASFLAGAGAAASRRASMRARCRCCGPVVALQMRTARRSTARGVPGGAARPARPRRRAARRGRDRRRAPERRRLPDRAVGAADAQLRPAARAHRRAPRRPARPRARARLSRADSGKCSQHSGFRSENVARRRRRLALASRGRDRRRRARPRPLRRARPAPARLRRALRRGRAGRAALRLPPLRRQRRRAAPAVRHRVASSRTGGPRSRYARGLPGIERVGLFGSSFGGGHAITLAARARGRRGRRAVPDDRRLEGLAAGAQARPRPSSTKLALQDAGRRALRPRAEAGQGRRPSPARWR